MSEGAVEPERGRKKSSTRMVMEVVLAMGAWRRGGEALLWQSAAKVREGVMQMPGVDPHGI